MGHACDGRLLVVLVAICSLAWPLNRGSYHACATGRRLVAAADTAPSSVTSGDSAVTERNISGYFGSPVTGHMATFFGEVVPVFSRAVDEDDDDDDEQEDEDEEDREIRREIERKREVVLKWSSETSAAIEASPEHMLSCSSLILAVGENAAGFVSSHILSSGSWEVSGHITLWNDRTPRCDGTSCVFYRSVTDPTVMLCQCKCYVAEDQQFQWCDKVLSCLQKTTLKVTILSTCPVSDYKTPESTYNLPVPFLKVLKTKHYTDLTPCSPLEQPNILDGLPAAVMAHCQVWGIPAVCYQCYTDITKLDSITIEAFRPVLSCQSMSRLAAKSEAIVETLKKAVRSTEVQSNLYI